MADGSFSWVFELLDKVSSPAKTMDNRIKEMSEHLEKLQKQFSALAGVEMFKLAYEGAEKLVDKVKELGLEALRAADFERSAAINFKALTGNAELGEGMLTAAKRFALKAGTELKATVSQFAGLRMAGIVDPGNIGKLVAAAYDVQNKSFGRKSADSVLDMFSSIQTRGQLAGRMLMGMDGIISAKALGAQLGFNVTTMKQLQALLDKSPVGAAQGIKAIMTVLAGTKGMVGEVTKEIGQGWGGSVTKLQTAWDLLLGSFEKSDAFTNIIDIVNSVTDALNPMKDSGKRIYEIFSSAADAIGDMLKPLKSDTGMDDFLDGLETAKNIVLTIAQTFLDIGKFAGRAASVFSPDMAKGQTRMSAISEMLGLKKKEAQAPAAIGLRPFAAYEDMMRKVGETGGAAHMEGVKGPKGLDARSPSKAYERLGKWSIEGFNNGLNSGRISSPVASLPGMAGSGGGSRPAISFTINASTTDAKGLGERARDVVASALAAAFEEISLESGAS